MYEFQIFCMIELCISFGFGLYSIATIPMQEYAKETLLNKNQEILNNANIVCVISAFLGFEKETPSKNKHLKCFTCTCVVVVGAPWNDFQPWYSVFSPSFLFNVC